MRARHSSMVLWLTTTSSASAHALTVRSYSTALVGLKYEMQSYASSPRGRLSRSPRAIRRRAAPRWRRARRGRHAAAARSSSGMRPPTGRSVTCRTPASTDTLNWEGGRGCRAAARMGAAHLEHEASRHFQGRVHVVERGASCARGLLAERRGRAVRKRLTCAEVRFRCGPNAISGGGAGRGGHPSRAAADAASPSWRRRPPSYDASRCAALRCSASQAATRTCEMSARSLIWAPMRAGA